jgi:hypothetical protein
MVESLILFESDINSRWFLRTSIHPKIDEFKSKVPKVILLFLSLLVALGADSAPSSLSFCEKKILPLDPISIKPQNAYYDVSYRSTRRDSAYTCSKPHRLFVIIAVLTRVLILAVSHSRVGRIRSARHISVITGLFVDSGGGRS